jgi:hypothetical protein
VLSTDGTRHVHTHHPPSTDGRPFGRRRHDSPPRAADVAIFDPPVASPAVDQDAEISACPDLSAEDGLSGAGFPLAPRSVRCADDLRRREQQSSAPPCGQLDRAFEMLRDHSQHNGHKLVDIAQAIVDSHLLLLPPLSPGGTNSRSSGVNRLDRAASCWQPDKSIGPFHHRPVTCDTPSVLRFGCGA